MKNTKVITIGESTTKKALMQLMELEDKGLLDSLIVSALMTDGQVVVSSQQTTISEQYMLIGYLQSDAVIKQLTSSPIIID